MSNAPFDRESFLAQYARDMAERKLKAERKADYLCGALRFFGIAKVTATFDGYGDNGSIAEAVFDPPIRDVLPFGLVDEIHDV